MLRFAVKPGPVQVAGKTGGIPVCRRRSGNIGSKERSGTATVVPAVGVPVSAPVAAVAAELVVVEGVRCHGRPMVGRGGVVERIWVCFYVGSGRRASVEVCNCVAIVAVVALTGALVWLYNGPRCKRAGVLNRTKLWSMGSRERQDVLKAREGGTCCWLWVPPASHAPMEGVHFITAQPGELPNIALRINLAPLHERSYVRR